MAPNHVPLAILHSLWCLFYGNSVTLPRFLAVRPLPRILEAPKQTSVVRLNTGKSCQSLTSTSAFLTARLLRRSRPNMDIGVNIRINSGV
jgi:hypothetical protein